MERFLENLLYSSRWLLAPAFLGLSLALLALGVKFFQVQTPALPNPLASEEADFVLLAISLILIAPVDPMSDREKSIRKVLNS